MKISISMHKAFIDDKPLIFENVYNEISKGYNHFSILSEAEFSIDQVINKINESNVAGIVYLSASPDVTWNEFVSSFTLIEAAGGVVKNESDELLIIFRRKKWDLPKGKLDYDETPEEAAIREVKEECGIHNLELGKFLMKTFHLYSEKKKSILKKTHWYSMYSSDDEELIPEVEEDIEEVSWMDKEKIYSKVFSNTYASIKEVLENYFSLVK